MVSESELIEYARNIYRGVEGYTFEKVKELFPLYYYPIQGYYMMFFMEEQAEKNRELARLTTIYMRYLTINLSTLVRQANKYLDIYKDRSLSIEEFNRANRIRIRYISKMNEYWLSDSHVYLINNGKLSESEQLFDEYRDKIWKPSIENVIRR